MAVSFSPPHPAVCLAFDDFVKNALRQSQDPGKMEKADAVDRQGWGGIEGREASPQDRFLDRKHPFITILLIKG
jgi:hypothetical protein